MYQSINLFHDAKAQGEAVKDQMVTLVYRTQMQQFTIHEQKGKKKKEQNNIIISWWHNFNQTFKLQVNLIK